MWCRLLVAGGLACHGYLCNPGSTGCLIRGADGRWALPTRGLYGLEFDPQTRFGIGWIALRLIGPFGRVQTLLLEDQVPASAWSALQAGLRTGNWGSTGAAGSALLE
jgi:hypothetical protein